MSSIEEDDLRKSLKYLYGDLLDAEKIREKEPFGFKNRLKVIHETLQELEMKICSLFCLGDFGVLPDFESDYPSLGDSGINQILKIQIKLLAVEIGLDLEQENHVNKDDEKSLEKHTGHKWTRGEKMGLVGVIVAIVGTVIGFLIRS